MRKLLLLLMLLCVGVWAAERSGSSLKEGQKVPDFTLTNQLGKPTRLSDFKGKVVLITFLYTQCPYPDKCPMIAQKLDKTRDLLDQVAGGKDQFEVVSITLDPKRDTPDSLKAYQKIYDQNASNWTFLTGKPTEVAKVASLFGVTYYTEKGVIEHNMRTAVLDKDLKLRRLFLGNDWKPGEVAAMVRDLLSK